MNDEQPLTPQTSCGTPKAVNELLQTRCVNSARHTLEVDFREHARELLQDLAGR